MSSDVDELYVWQDPESLCRSGDRVCHEVFRSRQGKGYREAWVIGRLGMLVGARLAKLCRDDQPDGFVLVGKKCFPVEVTECLDEGRMPQAEDWSLKIRFKDNARITSAIENNECWVRSAIEKKLRKDALYPSGTILVVYLNTSLYNFNPNRTRRELERCCDKKGLNIAATLVLFEGEVYGNLAAFEQELSATIL